MGGEEKRPSPGRWILLIAVALPVMAFVLPPLINISRYQHRIANSIGRSIGRPVHMSSVKLRLLPLPGFEFSDFSIEENPQFGSEPILHANSVVASLRLLSLWRGKLEIARIQFDEASLNLVHDSSGGWNVASILLQAAQIPNAPTGQRYAGSAPRFPYIEADNSRINFKEGNEKKSLSFLNSDLSISLAPADNWELHFRAQPVRTDLDLDLADTGVLRIDGTLHRAAMLEQMPLALKVRWSGVPLGQLSRLTLGRDVGWRGGLDGEAELAGTAELAQVNARIKVAGLHRSEFTPDHPLDLATTCRALFRKEARALEDIACVAPVGTGTLSLSGSIQEAQSRLKLEVDHVPASAVLAGLQELRNGLGAGLKVGGNLDGHFDYSMQSGRPSSALGEVAVDLLALAPSNGGKPFLIGPVRVRCDAGSPALLLQPLRLPMGAALPVTVDGRFTSAGFDLHVSGTTSLARLQAFNKDLGVLGAHAAALGGAGTASFDLGVRGKWLLPVPDSENPVASSTTEGSISLRNAEFTSSYLSQPLKVASAQGILSPTQIAWANASLSYGELQAQGTLEYPVLCAAGAACMGHFSLTAPALDLALLQSTLLGSSEGGELLRQILDRIDRRSVQWPDLSGTVQVGTLSAGRLVVHDAVSAIEVGGNAIKIRSLTGHVANGTMHLTGAVVASGDDPEYRMDVQVTNAAPAALASIFEEHWGSGSANFSAQWRMAGYDLHTLAQSAAGTLRWDWTKGGLPGDDPLGPAAQPFAHFDQWSAETTIADGSIRITHSLLARGQDAIPVQGTISFNREIDFTGGTAAQAFTVTGTLQHPEMKASPDAAAN